MRGLEAGNMTYISEEPVSKSMTKVWPPTVTGDRNSASFWLEVADTSPFSDPLPLDAAKSAIGTRFVAMSSSGTNPKP